MAQLKTLKQGDYFTLKPIQYPNECQVYIKGEYDRTVKRYSCVKFSDVNYERMFDGTKEVYTDFIF